MLCIKVCRKRKKSVPHAGAGLLMPEQGERFAFSFLSCCATADVGRASGEEGREMMFGGYCVHTLKRGANEGERRGFCMRAHTGEVIAPGTDGIDWPCSSYMVRSFIGR